MHIGRVSRYAGMYVYIAHTVLALMYPNAAIAVSLEAYPCCFLTAIPFTATPFTATSFRTSLQSFCTLVSRCGCSVLHQLILRHHWQMSKLNHFIKYILEPCHPSLLTVLYRSYCTKEACYTCIQCTTSVWSQFSASLQVMTGTL